MIYYESNYGFRLGLTREDAEAMCHPGRPCDAEVSAGSEVPYIAEQLAKLDHEDLRQELKQYGAWNAEELANHAQNLQRILWLAAWDIVEQEVNQ